MLEINKILKQNNLHATSYQKLGNTYLINTKSGKKVIKKEYNKAIYDYLNSRSFIYYPNSIIADNYIVMDYIEDKKIPNEQKLSDMIKLVALLHNKTTYYKEVNEDYYKKIYEDILNKINYLNNYYHDIISIIDTKIYMSPSEYLLANGISKIFNSLNYCHNELEEWFNSVKENKKQRYAVIHNNLDLEHIIINNNPYLISWSKAKYDLPLFDFYTLYKSYALEYDFDSLLKLYEKDYPLNKDERKLLFILISLPDIKINWSLKEYDLCKKISSLLDYLYKTDTLISPYYSNDTINNK